MTNADRIRSMTDEELVSEYFYILNKILGRYIDSRPGLLEWLKEDSEIERARSDILRNEFRQSNRA